MRAYRMYTGSMSHSLQIPIISLFCGCGGLDLGFVREGFNVLLTVDSDAATATKTYNLNHDGRSAQVGNLPYWKALMSSSCSRRGIQKLHQEVSLADHAV